MQFQYHFVYVSLSRTFLKNVYYFYLRGGGEGVERGALSAQSLTRAQSQQTMRS